MSIPMHAVMYYIVFIDYLVEREENTCEWKIRVSFLLKGSLGQ